MADLGMVAKVRPVLILSVEYQDKRPGHYEGSTLMLG
jgi:hypothetical protein